MHKNEIICLGFIFMLLLSFGVYAIGSSEGGIREGTQERVNDSSVDLREQERVNCEESNTRRERIKCRLINADNVEENEINVIPEACRGLNTQEACQRLYRNVRHCYAVSDNEKAQCFRSVSGFVRAEINQLERNEIDERARNYVVTLLYELEERIEKANEEGKIDSEEASLLIDKIVEIKKDVLNGATKTDIRIKMTELKRIWRASII